VGLIVAVIAGGILAWLATKFIKIVGYIVGHWRAQLDAALPQHVWASIGAGC